MSVTARSGSVACSSVTGTLTRKTAALGAGLALVLLISACTGDERPFTEAAEAAENDVGRINVSVIPGTLTPVSVAVGGQVQLGITAFSTAGVQIELEAEDRNWSVSDTSVAAIDRDGLLTGRADGMVDVNFAFGGLQATSLQVIVSSAALDGITRIVGDTALDVCLGANYAAVGSVGGLERALSDVTWNLEASNVGELISPVANPGGIFFIPTVSGTRSLTARTDAFSQTLDVSVADSLTELTFPEGTRAVAEGETIQLTASGTFVRDGVETRRAVTNFVQWEVIDGTGSATISSEGFDRGVLTAGEAGTVSVEASCAGFRATGQVVLITSNDEGDLDDGLSFEQGESQTIALTGGGLQLAVSTGSSYDEDDDVSDDVDWSSRNSSIVVVDSSGFITPINPGTTTIEVELDGETETISITVI